MKTTYDISGKINRWGVWSGGKAANVQKGDKHDTFWMDKIQRYKYGEWIRPGKKLLSETEEVTECVVWKQ